MLRSYPKFVPVLVALDCIELEPGSTVTIHGLGWEQFEAYLEELGEGRSARIAYFHGALEIMAPLPAHERPHGFIADVVKAILDAQGRDWEDFGSTTFKKKTADAGLEPDTCFYIQNAQRVRNCLRMDLEVYPPPDLAIEADLTSTTTLAAYQALQVPEVWIYSQNRLTIHLLRDDRYEQSQTSEVFGDLLVAQAIPRLLQQALQQGSSQVLRSLRTRLAEGKEL